MPDPGFLALWNDIEPGREAEYDRWHTREHVPFLAAGPAVKRDFDLGVRSGFADLAATAGEWLGVPSPQGTSTLGELLR